MEGADFDRVAHRYERDGGVEGVATVYGTWLGDHVRVTRQTDEILETASPDWTDPPCPPPPGGWPRGGDSAFGAVEADLEEFATTGAVVSTVIFRPGRKRAVLVVAATDIEAVEARLRPKLEDRLCVVASRWTRAQLDAAENHLVSMADDWRLYQLGPHCDEQAQASMSVKLVQVTQDVAHWCARQPDGLITLEPWLLPTRLLGP